MRINFLHIALSVVLSLCAIPVFAAELPEGGFHVSQWTGENWEEVYQHQFQIEYSTETFTLDTDGKATLRIVQAGEPFADIDQISLMVDTQSLTPTYARYTENGESILEDILELDHNVVIAHEQEIEISWDIPGGYDSATVYLTANEYGYALPFHFPESGYAAYEIGSNTGSITVDGLIPETDGDVPLYSPYWQPSTGHPEGYTHIYICDDDQYVYLSLDVTMDNTNEYGEDWAEIRILQPDGSEQAFYIDDFDDTWGESGFGLTGKVSYKHQTCEFAIPKTFTGNGTIEFSLAYYGTGGVSGYAFADADVAPLVIKINGDPSSGQVFNVGDMLTIEGYVNSIATASGEGYLLNTGLSCNLRLGGPGNPAFEYVEYTDYDGGYPGPTWVQTEYNDSLWFTHGLTTPGEYTIYLHSDAHAGISDLEGNHILSTSDYAQESLVFHVNPAVSETYSICGIKYADWQGDEIPLENWKIKLEKSDVGGWTENATAITDEFGAYCFEDLLAGDYRVSEELKVGWDQVSPSGNESLITLDENYNPEVSYDFHNTTTLYCYDGTAWVVCSLDGTEPAPTLFTPKPKPFDDTASPYMPTQSWARPADTRVITASVQPAQVAAGQPVTIMANVKNSGDLSGSFTAQLSINGQVESTQKLAVPGNGALPVEFTVVKDEPGVYTVDINGQKAYFTVVAAQAGMNSTTIVYTILGVLAALAIILLMVFTLRRRFSR